MTMLDEASKMQPSMNSHREIIQTWGRQQMADDLGVPAERVRGWERKDSLPAEYWRDVLSVASERDIAISPRLLIDLAARD